MIQQVRDARSDLNTNEKVGDVQELLCHSVDVDVAITRSVGFEECVRHFPFTYMYKYKTLFKDLGVGFLSLFITAVCFKL